MRFQATSERFGGRRYKCGGCSTPAGQYRQHPGDERVQLRHIVAQELGRRVVGDLPVVGDELGLELDVRLRSIHLGRVVEAQDAAQALLRHGGPDSSTSLPIPLSDRGHFE